MKAEELKDKLAEVLEEFDQDNIVEDDIFADVDIKQELENVSEEPDVEDEISRVKYLILHGSYFGFSNENSPIGIIPSFVIRKMGLITYDELFEADFNIKLNQKHV